MDRFSGMFAGLRTYWENLSERERMLVGVMGGVAGLLFILLPVYLLSTSISDLEEDNQQIPAALRRISHSRGRLAAQQGVPTMAGTKTALSKFQKDWNLKITGTITPEVLDALNIVAK